MKFLCDSMLIGVSKELRKLGIDCVEIQNTVDINRYIDMARRESRYVLTRDSRYSIFSRELPQKQCLQIPSDSVDFQVLNILQYFQLQIDETTLFTRCIQCNGDNFLLANRYEMQSMRFPGTLQNKSDLPSYKGHEKTWNLKRISNDIIASKRTSSGKEIQVNRISQFVLINQNYFFICDNCGLCTWPDAMRLNQTVSDYLFPNSASGYATCCSNVNGPQ